MHVGHGALLEPTTTHPPDQDDRHDDSDYGEYSGDGANRYADHLGVGRRLLRHCNRPCYTQVSVTLQQTMLHSGVCVNATETGHRDNILDSEKLSQIYPVVLTGSLDLESDALPIEPPRHPNVTTR